MNGIKCLLILLSIFIFSCSSSTFQGDEKVDDELHSVQHFGNLDSIIQRGKLIALTDNSATSYFIYRGQPMGYEYELLSLFAHYIGVQLEMKVIHDIDLILDSLENGSGDIVAANLTVTKERRNRFLFSEPHLHTRQVLIQRLPTGYTKMTFEQIQSKLIKEPIELAGKTVHVPENTSFYDRLIHIQNEIGDSLDIKLIKGLVLTDSIMALVSKGEIEYAIADENVARFYKTFYSNIDVSTAISFNQNIAWALPKHAQALRDTINAWMNERNSKSEYAYIYNKYFKWAKRTGEKAKSPFNLADGGQISPYDDVIKEYAETLGWPWPLLASVVYHESQFDPEAESWHGARGLMQVMPETGLRYGADSIDLFDPTLNIRVGTAYLKWLYEYWTQEMPDSNEAAIFALASYNVGLGHIKDAQRLALKNNFNPHKWDNNVAEMILLKSNPKYYNDEVVLHGYCRGSEPFRYIKDVLALYDHYRNFVE